MSVSFIIIISALVYSAQLVNRILIVLIFKMTSIDALHGHNNLDRCYFVCLCVPSNLLYKTNMYNHTSKHCVYATLWKIMAAPWNALMVTE